MSNGEKRAKRTGSGADSEADRADTTESGDVAEDEVVDEPYPADELDDDELGSADVAAYEESDGEADVDEPKDTGERHTDQDKWRRVAWIAVISAIIGVGWALTLSTILLNRSGDRTAELISLFESGQEARDAALAGIPQSQAERRAAIKALQEQSQLFKAQALSAFAAQSESSANSRQAIANAALADAKARKANTPSRKATTPSAELTVLTSQARAIADLESSINRMRKSLTQAINKLQETIKNLGPRP